MPNGAITPVAERPLSPPATIPVLTPVRAHSRQHTSSAAGMNNQAAVRRLRLGWHQSMLIG
jgi:hypothetical protein